jgi:hypothetical protein
VHVSGALDGREWRKEVSSEPLEVADTLYADDTGEFFKTRADAVQDVPLLVEFLAKFGLFVHVKLPGQKKSKSVLMYHSAPNASYQDFSTLDGECFDDIDVGGGSSIHAEPSAGAVPGQSSDFRRQGRRGRGAPHPQG